MHLRREREVLEVDLAEVVRHAEVGDYILAGGASVSV